MKQHELMSQLRGANLSTHVLSASNGGSILITPHGARILGVFTHPDADNAYYVNPELATPATAADFLSGEHILGGDRLWIAPQLGIIFTNRTIESQTVPPTLDPGHYQTIQTSETSIHFANHIHTPYFPIPESCIQGDVKRSIRLVPSPLTDTQERIPAVRTIHYIGYEISTQFTLIHAPHTDIDIGLWFIVQIAVTQWGNEGYAFIPTFGRGKVTHYFSPVDSDYLSVTDTHVRFKLDAARQLKIGICKTEVAGRIGFLSHPDSNGNGILIIRNFFNNPSGQYVDIPLSHPASTQDSVQIYNDSVGTGGLGELEFHTSAINLRSDSPVIHDCNQIWIFSGQRNDLVLVAARLLGLSTTTFEI